MPRARFTPSLLCRAGLALMSLALAWLALAHFAPARAQDQSTVAPADAQAIHEVISDQLDAFRHDDGTRAFSYASPMIQGKFGSPDIFMEMVKTAYTPVYRAHDVQFQGLDLEAGVPVQRVRMIGPDGLPVIVIYMMERQPDGTWKVNGVLMTRSDDLST
jgi:hypothetical protein